MIITPANTIFELLAFYVATYHVSNNSIRLKNNTISFKETYDNLITHEVSFNHILNIHDATIDKDTCVYCKSLANSVDHIISQYHGGTDELLNLVPCCKYCNSSKGKKDLFDWTREINRRLSLNTVCRYLILMIEYCESKNILSQQLYEINRTSNFSLLDHFELFESYASQIKGSLHISLLKDMTLIEAIDTFTKDTRFAIAKYFETVEINTWEDLSTNKLESLRNMILNSVAPASARTYFLTICSLLNKFREIRSIPPNYRSILYIRNDKPTQIYLTAEELRALAVVSVNSLNEKYVKSTFFISAITGFKLSQIKEAKEDDLIFAIKSNDYSITEEINSMISCIINFNNDISLVGYGKILRRLAKKANILSMINVHRQGKDIVCPKYKCLTSSVAINTYNAKVSKVIFDDAGSLFDLSVESKMNLPLDEWENVDIAASIIESLTNNNISLTTIASKMAIKDSELLSYINGETPINMKLLGKLLWVLSLKLQ